MKRWTLAFTLVLAVGVPAVAVPSAALAAPSNDNFSNATVVSAVPFNAVVNTADATVEPGEPMPCNNIMNGSIWYSYTPTTNVVVTVDNFGTNFSTGLNAYQSVGGGLAGLNFLTCTEGPGATISFTAHAGVTYYVQTGILFGQVDNLHVGIQAASAPTNDNFASAKQFSSLPFTDTVDLAGTSLEPGEPTPNCFFPTPTGTIWYAFIPTSDGSFTASAQAFNQAAVTAYSGSSLTALTNLGCSAFGNPLTILVKGGQTYYLQVGGAATSHNSTTLSVALPPPPQANFFFSPFDPSSFDTVQFNDSSFDPAGLGIQSQAWSFGDNGTATGCCVSHRYAADGDYAVNDTVTTSDGRTAVAIQTVHVRTHDVAITKFSVPNSASTGQTRQIVVGISSKRSQETVQVQLSRSTPNGFQVVGTLTQTIPANTGNQTTPFTFNYTFTADDATPGKVTFQAIATIVNGRDALPGDNTATATPTTVKR